MLETRDLPDTTLACLLRRIEAAAAALPASPDAALEELDAVRRALIGQLNPQPSTPRPRPLPALHLTARERQVLRLLARGDRNKEIALHLGLRERTVKFHVANVLAKLGAHSRTEALRRALEMDLILAENG